jgi:MFS family permease
VTEVWQHFRRNWSRYGLVFIGYGTTSITAFSVMTWTPALYQRQYGATIGQAAAMIGSVALAGGLLGAVTGGAVSDRLEQRGIRHAKLLVLFGCGVGLLLPSVIAPLMPSIAGHAAWIFWTFFFGTAATGPGGAYVQAITPDRMRAQFGAAYQLSLTLVGATLGPFSVALLTDYVFRDEARLGHSMAIVSAIANPIAAFVLWLAWSRATSRPPPCPRRP